MLSKKNKIQKKKETEEVFKKGKSSFDELTGVKVLETENKINRFVIVVSAKVSKKAVVRNRIKRRLNEVARLNLKNLNTGYDFFILALPRIINLDYHQMEKSLLRHFKKLKVIKTKA